MYCKLSLVGATLLAVAAMPLAFLGRAIAEDFIPPPQAEREAVAAFAKQGGRVQVDGEYRVTSLQLGAVFTDDDLKSLAACERLTSLQLSSPRITDAAIPRLKGLSRLTTLTIVSTGLTDEGIASLRTALPNCRINSLGRGGRGFGGGPGGLPGGFGDRGNGPVEPAVTAGRNGFNPTGFSSGGFGRTSRTTLARNSAVQEDLKLTPEQRQQISAAIEANSAAAILKATEEKIAAVLTPEQLARLKQIELQQLGIMALTRPDTAKELMLTEDQVAQITKLRDETSESLRTAINDLNAQRPAGQAAADMIAKMREKSAELNKARDEKILAVLSDQQRTAWLTQVGPKGPEINSAAAERFNFAPRQTPAEAAKSVFSRYDADKDGKLSEAEFPESNRTRNNLTRSGAALQFPIASEDFEKLYIKYLEGNRTRRGPGGVP